MKFIISRLELNDLINRVQGIVGTKPTIPILGNVLIEAAHDELILTTNDLTIGIRCYAETKVIEEGAITLPMKRFAQLIRELTATNLEISTHQGITEVMADASSFKLHGMNPAEFPALPDLEGAVRFTLSQPSLKEMFFRTSFAASREDNRYALTGVFMQISNSVATFVASDGRRLSRTHVQIDLPPDYSGTYSIPLKAVEEISRNLTEDPEEIATVYLLSDRIAVEANHVTVITKLLQGEYPAYDEVIPGSCETILNLHREELISLLRQISLFISDDSPSVRFTFDDGSLVLTKNSSEGEGKVSMPLQYQGAKLEIALHPQWLLDILRHCNQELVTVGLIDAFNPSVVTDQKEINLGTTQPSPLYVLMPMRLSEV